MTIAAVLITKNIRKELRLLIEFAKKRLGLSYDDVRRMFVDELNATNWEE